MRVSPICDCGKRSTVSLKVAIQNLLYTDEVSNFRKSLTELKDDWLCSDAASDRNVRSDVIMRVSAIDTLLLAIESFGKEVVQ